jgi:hypothetical protein
MICIDSAALCRPTLLARISWIFHERKNGRLFLWNFIPIPPGGIAEGSIARNQKTLDEVELTILSGYLSRPTGR